MSKYNTLAEFKCAFDIGMHPHAVIVVDNDSVYAIDDCKDSNEGILYQSDDPREVLHEALSLLGLKSENC